MEQYTIKRINGIHTWIYLYRNDKCIAYLSDGSGDESYETPSIMADDETAKTIISKVYNGTLSLRER